MIHLFLIWRPYTVTVSEGHKPICFDALKMTSTLLAISWIGSTLDVSMGGQITYFHRTSIFLVPLTQIKRELVSDLSSVLDFCFFLVYSCSLSVIIMIPLLVVTAGLQITIFPTIRGWKWKRWTMGWEPQKLTSLILLLICSCSQWKGLWRWVTEHFLQGNFAYGPL